MTEVEAVARALYRDEGGTKDGEIHWRYYETAEKAIAALDAARSTQDEGHTERLVEALRQIADDPYVPRLAAIARAALAEVMA